MVKNLNPFWTKKFGSIPGGMKYIPAAMPCFAAVAAILSSGPLIEVALVVKWHPQLDRKIGRTDQQDVDARDRGDGIEVLQRLVRLDHRHDNELVIHGIHVIAVILEFAPLAADPGVAAVAEGKIAAGAHGGLRLLAGIDHRHNDAASPGVKREADLIGLVRGDAHQRRSLLAA